MKPTQENMKKDRVILKVAKANHKQAMKNMDKFIKDRDAMLMRIIESPVPDWGNIRVFVVKY